MTQEEKARAYDEALERAKEQIKECGDNEGRKKMIRNIFPELHESEDERIRKALIQFLNDIKSISESGRTSWAIRKEDAEICNGFITYLEKQKEQKPETFNEPYNPDDYEVVMEGNATSLKRKEQKLNIELIQRSWYMEGYNDREFSMEPKWIIKTGEGGPKHELNPKYGQPLADEQKPAEWSEEDEKQLDDIISIIREAYEHGITISETRHRNAYFWLTNLRPPFKPSEEQMKALELVVNFLKPRKDTYEPKKITELESLYEQLQEFVKS